MADLVPVSKGARFADRSQVARILRVAPLDARFSKDVEEAAGSRVDEL